MIKEVIIYKTKEKIIVNDIKCVDFLPYHRKEKIKTLLMNKVINLAQRDKVIYICDECGKEDTSTFGYSDRFLNNCLCKGCQIKQTKKELYGNANYNNHSKTEQTKLKKYGDANYTNRNKMKTTMLERYGVEYSMQSSECREKVKVTWLEKYGTDEILKRRDLLEEGMMKKYGVKNGFESEEIKEKIMQTNIKRYGKMHIGGRCKMYELDGHKLQGLFEVKVGQWLIDNNIKFQSHEMKGIKYNDVTGKMRYYYPDFYLMDYDVYLEPHAKYFWDEKFEWKMQEVEKQINILYFDEEYDINDILGII